MNTALCALAAGLVLIGTGSCSERREKPSAATSSAVPAASDSAQARDKNFSESSIARQTQVFLDGELVATVEADRMAPGVDLGELAFKAFEVPVVLVRATTGDGRALKFNPAAYPTLRPRLFVHEALGASVGLFAAGKEPRSSEAHQFLAGARRVDVYTAMPKASEELWDPLDVSVGALPWPVTKEQLDALTSAEHVELPKPGRLGKAGRGRKAKARGWHIGDVVGTVVARDAIAKVVITHSEGVTELLPRDLEGPPPHPKLGDRWTLLKRNRRGIFKLTTFEIGEDGLDAMRRLSNITKIDIQLGAAPSLLVAKNGEAPRPVGKRALEALPSVPGERGGWDLRGLPELVGLAKGDVATYTLRSGPSDEKARVLTAEQIASATPHIWLNRRGLLSFELLRATDADAPSRARRVVRIDIATRGE